MLPDLGIERDCGVLDTNKQLMSLRNQDDPIVVIWKEESKVEGKTWVKDNKVIVYVDSGHIPHDLASTQV